MPACPVCIPTVSPCCLDLDFSNSHFDRLINFVDTETSGQYSPLITLHDLLSVPSVCRQGCPILLSLAAAPLIRQHSLAIVLCGAAWVGQLPLAGYPFPFPLYLLPFSSLSRSLHLSLSAWPTGHWVFVCGRKLCGFWFVCLPPLAGSYQLCGLPRTLPVSLALSLSPSPSASFGLCVHCNLGLSAVGNRADCLS